MNRRRFLSSVSALALALVCSDWIHGSSLPPGTWSKVHIGGGGYVTGIDADASYADKSIYGLVYVALGTGESYIYRTAD
jgi:hypothetical protein